MTSRNTCVLQLSVQSWRQSYFLGAEASSRSYQPGLVGRELASALALPILFEKGGMQ